MSRISGDAWNEENPQNSSTVGLTPSSSVMSSFLGSRAPGLWLFSVLMLLISASSIPISTRRSLLGEGKNASRSSDFRNARDGLDQNPPTFELRIQSL